jgi:hypothetical protein
MAELYDALNYPFIRVRSVDWLKSTLLLFPHVARIRPSDGPGDDPEIEVFTQTKGAAGCPLLWSVEPDEIDFDHQEELRRHISAAIDADRAGLQRRFGEKAAARTGQIKLHRNGGLWHERLSRGSFQIHSAKVLPSLLHLLRHNGLAWDPTDSNGMHYLEMHPVVGEAVMSTLALACAREQGMRVVTEFPELYAKTIQHSPNDIFESVTARSPRQLRLPLQRKGERLAETIVYRRCDLSKLDTESLAILSKEHEALSAFRDAIEGFAEIIPTEMTDENRINSALEDRADFVIKKWRETKRNSLPKFLEIFGDESDDALKDLVKDGFKDAAKGAVLSAPTGHALIGAGAGVAIGVVWRMVSGEGRDKSGTAKSLRYLNMLQAHGVGVGVTVGP